MDLTVNLAPSYRDLKDPTTRQNFDDTVEQKRVIDLRACRIIFIFGKETLLCQMKRLGWMSGFGMVTRVNCFVNIFSVKETLNIFL